MDHFKRLKSQLRLYSALSFCAASVLLIGGWWLLNKVLPDTPELAVAITGLMIIIIAIGFALVVSEFALSPLRIIWQAILHVSPGDSPVAAPDLETASVGRELVTSLCLQVYQLASSVGKNVNSTSQAETQAQAIVSSLPLPLLVMNKDQTIIFANDSAHKYLSVTGGSLIGKNFYSSLNLSFPSNDTFDNWLASSKAQALVSSHSWERVRLQLPERGELLQFDMAAYYNKQNPAKVETIVALFDHTKRYSQDDNSLSFIALAVHELRTPLTLLRGYIEVFQEELNGKLDAELTDFMRKMEASAQQLSAFVNNILNVARVESDQLILQLNAENWNDIVKTVANDLSLRAQVLGKTIELNLSESLPMVAADRISIYEVLANLLDNAIKYSGKGQKIIITTTLMQDRTIQTTVQDFGVGIATNIVPHLFEKFYRSYHTQQHFGGTGLGLYLSKIIIKAHGGNIWVRSREGIGTTIGFSLKPFAELADELKNGDNKDITRNAHGWIKNHSLYRR